ncbi:hypothetical protein V6N13_103320 [Hibiscus sabdariffa]
MTFGGTTSMKLMTSLEYNQGGIRLCPKGSKLMAIHLAKVGMCREHLFKELKFGVNQVVVLASLIRREICSENFCGLGYGRLRFVVILVMSMALST